MKEEQYTIKDLEKLSGIKAHTIRMWEKRYALLEPNRTDTNIRYYNGNDLKKLLNISILNKNGIKISHIAKYTAEIISAKVIELTSRSSDVEDQIQSFTMAMFNLDQTKFEKLLAVSYINRGFENTFNDIIFPFLRKIGLLWQTGTINSVHEHFAANIIKHKLIVAIDNLSVNYNNDSKKYVLFLPEDEQHEIGLLYTYYTLKKNRHKVMYLGCSVPFSALSEINVIYHSHYIVLAFMAIHSSTKIFEYLKNLSEKFTNQQILVFGINNNVPGINTLNNIKPVNKTIEVLPKH